MTTFQAIVERVMDFSVLNSVTGAYEKLLSEVSAGRCSFDLYSSWVFPDGRAATNLLWEGEVSMTLNLDDFFSDVVGSIQVRFTTELGEVLGHFDGMANEIVLFLGPRGFEESSDVEYPQDIKLPDERKPVISSKLARDIQFKWRDTLIHELTHAVDHYRGVSLYGVPSHKTDPEGYMHHGVETNARFTQTLDYYVREMTGHTFFSLDDFKHLIGYTPQEFADQFWDTFVYSYSQGFEYDMETKRQIKARAAGEYETLRSMAGV